MNKSISSQAQPMQPMKQSSGVNAGQNSSQNANIHHPSPPSVQPHQSSGLHEQLKQLREQNKNYQKEIQNHIEEKESTSRKSQIMTNLLTSLDIENETQKKQIQELQQIVLLLSSSLQNLDEQDSLLGPKQAEISMIQKFASEFSLNLNLGGNKTPGQGSMGQMQRPSHNSNKQNAYYDSQFQQPKKFNIHDKISQALSRMDLLLKENFELKREIVFERKKYVDLNQAYQDLRNNLQEGIDFYPSMQEDSQHQLSVNQSQKENISVSPDRRVGNQQMQGMNFNINQTSQNPNQVYTIQGRVSVGANKGFASNNFQLVNNKNNMMDRNQLYMQHHSASQVQADGQHIQRNSAQSQYGNMSQISSMDSSGKWKLEKNKMQQTILTLSQEVEYLSARNSKLLQDLKRKEPMYDVYVQTTEELIKLRQAHTVLISMIQSGNVNIKQHAQNLNDQSIDLKNFDSSQNFSSRSHLQQLIDDGTQKPSQGLVASQNPMQGNERLGRWLDKQKKPTYRGGIGMDIQELNSSARGNNRSQQKLNQSNLSDRQQYQRNISIGDSVNRNIGVAEFITCGTMFRSENQKLGKSTQPVPSKIPRNISKDRDKRQKKEQQNDFEKQMLNNEYLKILKDPKFSDLNVNFLDF